MLGITQPAVADQDGALEPVAQELGVEQAERCLCKETGVEATFLEGCATNPLSA